MEMIKVRTPNGIGYVDKDDWEREGSGNAYLVWVQLSPNDESGHNYNFDDLEEVDEVQE